MLRFIIYKTSGLNFTMKSLPALKFAETSSRAGGVNTMCSANCFCERLETIKNFTDQATQLKLILGQLFLVAGAQRTDFLLALHYFCFPRDSNLWISSGVCKVSRLHAHLQKNWGVGLVSCFKSHNRQMTKSTWPHCSKKANWGWPGGGTGQYKAAKTE